MNLRISILLVLFCTACNVKNENLRSLPEGLDLQICTQNLNNFSESSLERKKTLAERIVSKDCDIIAVQEVLGKNIYSARKSIAALSQEISSRANRSFDFKLGTSNDNRRFLGFIFARSKFKFQKEKSYHRTYLPKLEDYDSPAGFSRGPFRLDLTHRQTNKRFSFVTFHFKSKSSKGGVDFSGYTWEFARMKMAQALNSILDEMQKENKPSYVIALGDRNNEESSASAKILFGEQRLEDFKSTTRKESQCQLRKSGKLSCPKKRKLEYASLMAKKDESLATYYYKNNPEWIDDIIAPLSFLEGRQNYILESSGVSFKNKNASDHGLLWLNLNYLN